MIRVIKFKEVESVSSACGKYNLSRFTVVHSSSKLKYKLVRLAEREYCLMHDKSFVLANEFNFKFWGDLETVIISLIDNDYEVYVDDKDL